MKSIILLAGTGTRLKPLTDNTHKALLQIGGVSILERQIRQLQKNGVTDFIFVLGHRAKDIQNYVAKKFFDLNAVFVINENFAKNNTAASLHLALQHFEDDFILLDGDVVMSDALLDDLFERLIQHEGDSLSAPCLLLSETDPEKLDAEAVKIKLHRGSDIIQDIGKHISLAEGSGESIGVGFYSKVWGETLKNFLDLELKNEAHWNWYYEDALHRLLNHGETPSPLKMVSTGEHPWVEVDDLNDFNRAREILWD